jgi:hypothetical protein
MDNDAMQRAETVLKRLHQRSLELQHPGLDHDMGEALQALALILEMQRDLAREQRRIIEILSHR